MTSEELKEELKQLLESAIKETGGNLAVSSKELANYMSERAAHLSTIVGQTGFHMAVIAERDSVALRAGLNATNFGDGVTQRLVGLLQGALALAAKLLAV